MNGPWGRKTQLLVSIVKISFRFFIFSMSILFVVTDTRESTAAMLSTSEIESLHAVRLLMFTVRNFFKAVDILMHLDLNSI